MIGESISHYRIIRELVAEGMGVVYEAVALEFLPPESVGKPGGNR
jgi:hypothetical protein